MGLTIDYFYSLTPRQFFNINRGWNERRDAESKERMILARRIAWSNLAPWSKGITEQKLWPFEWDNTPVELNIPTEEELQQSIDRWKARDEKLLNIPK